MDKHNDASFGGAISFSLSGKKHSLSEVKKALNVVASTFMQVYFSALGKKSLDSQMESIRRQMDSCGVVGYLCDPSLFNSVPIGSIFKDASKEELKNLSDSLRATNDVFKDVPIHLINYALKQKGYQILDEEYKPWAGFIVGDSGSAAFKVASIKDTTSPYIINNVEVLLSWSRKGDQFQIETYLI